MGGFFGVASRQDCVIDVFFGVDYHSHLGTKQGGLAFFDEHDYVVAVEADQAVFFFNIVGRDRIF